MIVLENKEPITEEGTYLLEDGAIVEFYPKWMGTWESTTLFERLKEDIPWEQCVGKFGPVPRLNAWNSAVGVDYEYSGIKHVGKGWNEDCKNIRNAIMTDTNYRFNSLLLNYYHHELPKEPDVTGERISLTFRNIL